MKWSARVLRYALLLVLAAVSTYVVGSIRMLQHHPAATTSSSSSSHITMKQRFIAAAAAWMDGDHDAAHLRASNRGLAELHAHEGKPFEEDDDSNDDNESNESLEYELEVILTTTKPHLYIMTVVYVYHILEYFHTISNECIGMLHLIDA
jgi:hypothetical protein